MTAKLRPAIITGLLAALIAILAELWSLPGWVAFLAWTAQNLLAREGVNCLVAFFAFTTGVSVAALSIVAIDATSGELAFISSPVFIGAACAGVALMAGRIQPRAVASAVFLGMIAWFGSRGVDQPSAMQTVLAAHILGLTVYQLSTCFHGLENGPVKNLLD